MAAGGRSYKGNVMTTDLVGVTMEVDAVPARDSWLPDPGNGVKLALYRSGDPAVIAADIQAIAHASHTYDQAST